VGHLGPDLLGPDWDLAEAEQRIRAAPDVPIGVALLDQRNLAGIGNIYRCEACFLSGVHPATPVSDVQDLRTLMTDAKQLLEANLGPGRRVTILNPRGMPVGRLAGRPGYWVYRREHQACLKCGTPIRRAVLGKLNGEEERDIYFCPKCQPLAD
jgi:endonuclease-8